MHITFTTLAVNQTHYFLALCLELERIGHTTSIISFHEESNHIICAAGIKVYNVFDTYRLENKDLNIESEFIGLLSNYQIDCSNILLSHEKVTFDIKKTLQLKKKFVLYFKALEIIFSELKNNYKNDFIVFQELGGFSSIISTFYVARHLGIDNIFLEPSFFKGRMFFVKNTFDSYKVREEDSDRLLEVTNYLTKVRENKTIVIPKKDVTHYRHPIKKIINVNNITRLWQKTFTKYLGGKQEEFNYIWSFVYRHIRMLTNRILLIKYYQKLPDEQFIYYPFHVPMDVALTIRAPLFVDQYALIDYISRNIPNGHKLVIKEHPAMIGVVHYNRLKDLLERNDNLILLNPDINNHEVMSKMELLVTVNSKTGAESLMLGKKVICLGDAFYNQSHAINYIDNVRNLYQTINRCLLKSNPTVDEIELFFQSTYKQTFTGELYDCQEKNIKESSNSIVNYLKANP